MPQSDLTIFIGGLDSSTTNAELLKYFGCFGVIRSCEVQCWKNNRTKCRGFALIEIADFTTYENILLTPHRLNGRPIEVKRMISDKSELEEHTQDLNDRKVFVSNLPKKLTDTELAAYFSKYGQVELAYIIKHHKDNKSKGFGFVLYRHKNEKQKVTELAEKDGFVIDGKMIVCSSYKAKRNKADESSISESFHDFDRKVPGGSDPLPETSGDSQNPEHQLRHKNYSLGRIETPDHNLKLNVQKSARINNAFFDSIGSTQVDNMINDFISPQQIYRHKQARSSNRPQLGVRLAHADAAQFQYNYNQAFNQTSHNRLQVFTAGVTNPAGYLKC